MSARSEFRRLARAAKRREAVPPKPHDPGREAEERVERAADERARYVIVPARQVQAMLHEIPLDAAPNGAVLYRMCPVDEPRPRRARPAEGATVVRWTVPAIKTARPPRDPVVEWTAKGLISREEADAAHWYRWAYHASRSTVTAAPLHSSGGGKGEAIPPQEIAMEGLEAMRLCEAAVQAELRDVWLEPVLVYYRSATSIAEQRGRESGRVVNPKGAMEMVRFGLGLLVPALAEWQRREAAARRAR